MGHFHRRHHVNQDYVPELQEEEGGALWDLKNIAKICKV